MATTTYEMQKRKETKGTVVFENDEAPTPSIYVRKGNEFAKAEKLFVTLSTEEK